MKKLLLLLPCMAIFFSFQNYLTPEGVPIPTHYYVNDFTGEMLSADQQELLEKNLKDYEDSTSTQVVVICLPALPKDKSDNDITINDLAHNTFRLWHIGQVKKNNGVLLIIALANRKAWIQTGYGAEANLTDILCHRIVEDDMAPLFKKKKYYEGIDKGLSDIRAAMSGQYQNDIQKGETETYFWWTVSIGAIIISIIGSMIGPRYGAVIGAIFSSVCYYYFYFPGDTAAMSYILALIIGGIVCWALSWAFLLGLFGGSDGSFGDGFLFSGDGGSGGGSDSGSFDAGGGSDGGGGGGGSW